MYGNYNENATRFQPVSLAAPLLGTFDLDLPTNTQTS